MSEEAGVNPVDVLFSLVLIFTGGAFFHYNLARLRLPYTFIMFVYGILMGVIGEALGGKKYADIFDGLNNVSPHLVFHVFLPILIFEGAYGMKTHAFWSIFSFVLILAGPGLVINTVLVGGALMLIYPSWNLFLAGLLGSILSATDPVAVVALLKDLGVDKRITAMVDGEAIMNDGTAIIMFVILKPAAVAGSVEMPWYELLGQCIRLIAVGVIFGWLMGWLMKQILTLSRTNEFVQTLITISGAYICFFVADVWMETSGVLALCFMGVYLATYMPTLFPGKEGSSLNTTWHFLVYIANTALFALVGVVIARHVFPHLEPIHLLRIFLLYLACTVARFIMIIVLKPTFYFNKNYVVGLRETALLVHGGLRGGVATMLALMVFETDGISDDYKNEVLIMVSGIVILTLAVNATTAKLVVSLLGHRSQDQNRLLQMDLGVARLRESAKKAIRNAKIDPLYAGTNWDRVEEILAAVDNPYEGVSAVKETEDRVFNVLLMRAFKTKMWSLRDAGTLSEDGICILSTATTRCIALGTLVTTTDVMTRMQFPIILRILVRIFLPRIGASSATTVSSSQQHHQEEIQQEGLTQEVLTPESPLSPNVPHAASPAGGGHGGYLYDPKIDFMYRSISNEEEAEILNSTSCSAPIKRLVLKWRLAVEAEFYAIFISYNEALELLENIYKEYAQNKQQAETARKWLLHEKHVTNRKIKVYAAKRPKTICSFLTHAATSHTLQDVIEEAEALHSELGFARPATEALMGVCHELQHVLHGWPSQIEPIRRADWLLRSSLFSDLPMAASSTLENTAVELNFSHGDTVSLGDAVGVVVHGVVEAFGLLSSVSRHRGAGDCFNIAPAVCRAICPDYVVTSKHCTVLAIPYSVLREMYNSPCPRDVLVDGSAEDCNKPPSPLFSLLRLAVGEAIAPIAKRYVLTCSGMKIEDIADRLAAHGAIVFAPQDGFCFFVDDFAPNRASLSSPLSRGPLEHAAIVQFSPLSQAPQPYPSPDPSSVSGPGPAQISASTQAPATTAANNSVDTNNINPREAAEAEAAAARFAVSGSVLAVGDAISPDQIAVLASDAKNAANLAPVAAPPLVLTLSYPSPLSPSPQSGDGVVAATRKFPSSAPNPTNVLAGVTSSIAAGIANRSAFVDPAAQNTTITAQLPPSTHQGHHHVLSPESLLAAIADPNRENLFFITGASHSSSAHDKSRSASHGGPLSSDSSTVVTPALGPLLLPLCAQHKLRWQKGTVLFVCKIEQTTSLFDTMRNEASDEDESDVDEETFAANTAASARKVHGVSAATSGQANTAPFGSSSPSKKNTKPVRGGQHTGEEISGLESDNEEMAALNQSPLTASNPPERERNNRTPIRRTLSRLGKGVPATPTVAGGGGLGPLALFNNNANSSVPVGVGEMTRTRNNPTNTKTTSSLTKGGVRGSPRAFDALIDGGEGAAEDERELATIFQAASDSPSATANPATAGLANSYSGTTLSIPPKRSKSGIARTTSLLIASRMAGAMSSTSAPPQHQNSRNLQRDGTASAGLAALGGVSFEGATSFNPRMSPPVEQVLTDDEFLDVDEDEAFDDLPLPKALAESARLLAVDYDPNACLTVVPFLNKLQLQFVAHLERLLSAMAVFYSVSSHPPHHNTNNNGSNDTANEDFVPPALSFSKFLMIDPSTTTTMRHANQCCGNGNNGGSSREQGEARILVATVTEGTLGFLQRFCIEGFSAEKTLYSEMLRAVRYFEREAGGSEISNKLLTIIAREIDEAEDSHAQLGRTPATAVDGGDVVNGNAPKHNSRSLSATPYAAQPVVLEHKAQSRDQRDVTSGNLFSRLASIVRRHEQEHSAFTNRLSLWRERVVEHSDLCPEAIAVGMAQYAARHFAEDSKLCRIAARVVSVPAEVSVKIHVSSDEKEASSVPADSGENLVEANHAEEGPLFAHANANPATFLGGVSISHLAHRRHFQLFERALRRASRKTRSQAALRQSLFAQSAGAEEIISEYDLRQAAPEHELISPGLREDEPTDEIATRADTLNSYPPSKQLSLVINTSTAAKGSSAHEYRQYNNTTNNTRPSSNQNTEAAARQSVSPNQKRTEVGHKNILIDERNTDDPRAPSSVRNENQSGPATTAESRAQVIHGEF